MTNYGYYIFGKDMLNADLNTLKKNGVTDLFLNYYAFTVHGESKVKNWINAAKKQGMNVHIWMQCFYDGSWHNPKTTDLTAKLKEAQKYANTTGVYGVHLDYLRYPGNAYQTGGGADAITNFVKTVRKQNPKTFLSCAVMPETDCKKYYGQDIDALTKTVDVIIPMQYKGNYNAGADWLKSTTKLFTSKATVWSALQSYKSDNNPTPLTVSELEKDIKICIDNKSKGVLLFRYGLSPQMKFKSDNMTDYVFTYATIVAKAKEIKKTVESEYKLPYSTPVYYIAKAILTPKKNIKKIKVDKAEKSKGDYFSRQIYASTYKDMAERLCKYVEKHNQLPNNIKDNKGKLMKVSDYVYMFARILVYYDKNSKLPKYADANSKAFIKPTEYPNKVYGLWVKYIKTKPKCLDDVCDYVKAHFNYLFYNDDVRSNEQVLKDKAGNCTDLLQMLTNMADAMDYDWEVYHVQCNVSKVGHVYGRFRKKDGSTGWFVRDIACIADESRYCVWCPAGDGGTLLAKNPNWFLQNRNR